MQIGWLAINNKRDVFKLTRLRYPLRQLLEITGAKKATKLYGRAYGVRVHYGYAIDGDDYILYEVHRYNKPITKRKVIGYKQWQTDKEKKPSLTPFFS